MFDGAATHILDGKYLDVPRLYPPIPFLARDINAQPFEEGRNSRLGRYLDLTL